MASISPPIAMKNSSSKRSSSSFNNTASQCRNDEWKRCCAAAMGFEWVDRFDDDLFVNTQDNNNDANRDNEDNTVDAMTHSVYHLINLLDDDPNQVDNDDDLEEENVIWDSENDMDTKQSTDHDVWMETALRIQNDLNHMYEWIQSKKQEYVGVNMKDDEASLIQSTVTSFAATTASELESLREMINATTSISNNMANHRSGIVQILLGQLQEQVTIPFNILQKQRTRIAVQIWQNPLQCQLYQPKIQTNKASSKLNDISVLLDDDDDDDDQDRDLPNQQFIPRRPYNKDTQIDTGYDFISKYAHRPSTRSLPTPPDFLTRLAKRQRLASSSSSSSSSTASTLETKSSQPVRGSNNFMSSMLSQKQQQQQQSKTAASSQPPIDYQQQLQEDLQEETVQLQTALISSNDLDSVQQMESRMVEITTLIGQFSHLVEEQQEQIIQVHESAKETKSNIHRGQENLIDATERTKKSKHYKAWIIFSMAIMLLFFHILKN